MRRRGWFITGGILIAALTALWLAGPRLGVGYLVWRAPFPLGDELILRGAGMGGAPAVAIEVRAAPSAIRAALRGLLVGWLPPFLVGHGQAAWGTIPALPGIDWSLHADAGRSRPLARARPTAGILGQGIANLVARFAPGQWRCDLRRLTVVADDGPEPDPAHRRLRFELSGDLIVSVDGRTSRFGIHRLAGVATIAAPGIAIVLEECAVEVPMIGSDQSVLRPWLEARINAWLEERLGSTPWPTWIPLDADIDIRCEAPPRVEL